MHIDSEWVPSLFVVIIYRLLIDHTYRSIEGIHAVAVAVGGPPTAGKKGPTVATLRSTYEWVPHIDMTFKKILTINIHHPHPQHHLPLLKTQSFLHLHERPHQTS